jgi:alanine dehydrogenase
MRIGVAREIKQAERRVALTPAYFLQAPLGGPGVLIGGVTGVAPARIVVIGGAVVGAQAARIALGTEGEVTILERSLDRLHELDPYFGGRARILMSDAIVLEQELREADVVIGAVLVPGGLAPRLVTRDMLGLMKPRSVVVDVAIDQGAALRPPIRRRTPIPCSRSTESCTTAWRTCPARFR